MTAMERTLTTRKKHPRGDLGGVLRRLREARSLSQKALSAATYGEVSASHIARIETGELFAVRDKIDLLAHSMELTTDEYEELLVAAGFTWDGEDGPGDRLSFVEQRQEVQDRELADLRQVLERIARRLDVPLDGEAP